MDMLNSWWGGGKTEEKTATTPGPNSETESKNEHRRGGTEDDAQVEDNAASSTTTTSGEETDDSSFRPELNITAEAAIHSAKEWGSYLFNFAMEGTKKVTETAAKTATIIQRTVEEKTIVGDFKKEQDKFVKEKHSKRAEAALPPWVGYNEEQQMKEQIMALSQDKRNFLRNPPAGVQFQFDFASMFPVAMATLQEDDKLQKMRFDLVPKSIIEENFWRNYFYRVSLIKQSSQLTSLTASSGHSSDSGSADTSSSKTDETPSENVKDKSKALDISVEPSPSSPTEDEVPGSPPGAEFISDAFVSEIDQAEIQKGFEQLGMDKKDDENNGKIVPVPTIVVLLIQYFCSAKLSPKRSGPSPSEPTPPPGEEDIPEWEKELQQELQEYEVVEEDPTGNEEWEREIDQMLEDEGAPESK